MKALCFGSMNIDYVYSVDHIVAPGETIASSKREVFAGGKGLNQSVAMAKAGLPVWHAGVSGTGGEFLLDILKENGVDTELIRKEDTMPGHTVIQVDAKGQNSIVLFGGTNQRITEEYIGRVMESFGAGDLILLQNEINLVDKIIDAAYAGGLRVALNPSPFNEAIRRCNPEHVSLFLLNEVEAAQISGIPATRPERILDWFEQHYPAAEVVLTLGAEGAWYCGKQIRHFCPAYRVNAVDTTAAGDTFTGYFLEGWMNGRPIEECMRRAAKAASIAVSRKGAAPSIPRAAELDE